MTGPDQTVIRRHLSVDFTLPKKLPTPLLTPDGEPVYFVPLTFLRRRPGPMHYDVRDEAQQALPLLTEREHSRITAAMLYQLAVTSATKQGKPPQEDDALAGALLHLPFRSFEAALPVVRAILNPESKDWEELPPTEALRDDLRGNPEFVDFLSLVAAHSVAVVPLIGPPGRRRVVKLAFEEQVADTAPEPLSPAQKIGIATAFKPRTTRLHAALIGAAETQHYQVTVPRNVEITGTVLLGQAPRVAIQDHVFGRDFQRDEDDAKNAEAQRYSSVQPGFASRAHVYVPECHHLSTGALWVTLRSERRGWLVGAALAALFITVALAGAAVLDDTLVHQAGSATSILLLVPGLTAAYMARPGEHPLATRLLRFARFLLAVAALSSFAAAGALLALAPTDSGSDESLIARLVPTLRADPVGSPDALFWTLVGLAFVAGACTALLAASVRYPRPERER